MRKDLLYLPVTRGGAVRTVVGRKPGPLSGTGRILEPDIVRQDARVGTDGVVAAEVQAYKDGHRHGGFSRQINQQMELGAIVAVGKIQSYLLADSFTIQSFSIDEH